MLRMCGSLEDNYVENTVKSPQTPLYDMKGGIEKAPKVVPPFEKGG